ncbi:MAG: PorP/SprF family type IX secretion system membrane protein [Luteibaculaceae bacterium]
MKKSLLALAVLVVTSLSTNAQQDPQFSQYMFDRLSFNPGFAGLEGSICATAIHRQQWAGFDGAPTSTLLNVHSPVSLLGGGLGLTVVLDELGQETNTQVRANYSYHLNVGPGKLGIGVGLGIANKAINGNNWRATDDVALDGSIPLGTDQESAFDLSFGLYYNTDDLFVGISSTRMSESRFDNVNLQMVRHYYAVAGYIYRINGDDRLKLQPSTLFKFDGVSSQLDLNVNFLYNNSFWGGVSYRTADAIIPMAGYQTELGKGMIRIGYSYDVTTSRLSTFSSGSHEIMLNYCFTIDKPQYDIRYKNPRFL